MRRTNIYLDEAQTDALDAIARAEGTSRASVIRRIVARSLAGDDRGLRAALDGIERSFGAWRDAETRVAARAPGAREDHLAAVWEGRS